jgi:hypothetical protein
MAISTRIFGADIPRKVKHKLIVRQELAKHGDKKKAFSALDSTQQYSIDESLDIFLPSFYLGEDEYNDNFDGQAQLSSRTPFVRMWTGIRIYDIPQKADPAVCPDYVKDTYDWDEDRCKFKTNTLETNIFEVGTNNRGHGDTRFDPNFSNTDPNYVGYEDHFFKQDHQTDFNQMLRPPAGITGLSSTTEKRLGATRVTTVNFTVHNITDFQDIYQRVFLRPGAQIFVDFGWDTLKPNPTLLNGKPDPDSYEQALYNQEDIMRDFDGNIDLYLYGDMEIDKVDGFVTRNQGDVDTVVGLVSNYSAKVNATGGFDCSVEITSHNSALFGFTRDEDKSKIHSRIQKKLDMDVIWLGILPFVSDEAKVWFETNVNDLSTSGQQDDYFKEFITYFQETKLVRGKILTPGPNAVLSGVYPAGQSSIDSFISIGLLEDYIINEEFGFGNSFEDINDGEGQFQVRFDSRNSWTHFDHMDLERQKALGGMGEFNSSYLFPGNWDKSYNETVNKMPDRGGDRGVDPKFRVSYDKAVEDGLIKEGEYTKFDASTVGPNGGMPKMPLRDLFVSTQVISQAFKESGENLMGCILRIFDRIKDDSYGRIQLDLFADKSNSRISIVDKNFTEIDSRQLGTKEINFFDNLFEFDITGDKSICTKADLNFNIPSGKIGTMYAIKSAGEGGKVFPLTDIIDDYQSLEILSHLGPIDGETGKVMKNVSYVPSPGKFLSEKLTSENSISETLMQSFARSTDYMFGRKYKPQEDVTIISTSDVQAEYNAYEESHPADQKPLISSSDIEYEARTETLKWEIETAQNEGKKVATTIEDYYKYLINHKFFIERRPTILQTGLSMTIYGMASINVGDCFRVNYMPRKYRDNVYFQVTKVQHDIGPDGWYTSLETVQRIRSDMKKKLVKNNYKSMKDVILSSQAIQNAVPGAAFPIENMASLNMKDIKPLPNSVAEYDNIAMAFSFTARSDKTIINPFDLYKVPKNFKNNQGEFKDTWKNYMLFFSDNVKSFLTSKKYEVEDIKVDTSNSGPSYIVLGYFQSNFKPDRIFTGEDIFATELKAGDKYFMIVNKSRGNRYWKIVKSIDESTLKPLDQDFEAFKNTMMAKDDAVINYESKEVVAVSSVNFDPTPEPEEEPEGLTSEEITRLRRLCEGCSKTYHPLALSKTLALQIDSGQRPRGNHKHIRKRVNYMHKEPLYPPVTFYTGAMYGPEMYCDAANNGQTFWLSLGQWKHIVDPPNDETRSQVGEYVQTATADSGLRTGVPIPDLFFSESPGSGEVCVPHSAFFTARHWIIKQYSTILYDDTRMELSDGRTAQACILDEGHIGNEFNKYYSKVGAREYAKDDDNWRKKHPPGEWSEQALDLIGWYNPTRMAGIPNPAVCNAFLNSPEACQDEGMRADKKCGTARWDEWKPKLGNFKCHYRFHHDRYYWSTVNNAWANQTYNMYGETGDAAGLIGNDLGQDSTFDAYHGPSITPGAQWSGEDASSASDYEEWAGTWTLQDWQENTTFNSCAAHGAGQGSWILSGRHWETPDDITAQYNPSATHTHSGYVCK